MTKPSIKVLLIEDNRDDAQLMMEALAKEPYAFFELTHAERLSTGLAHLKAGGIDLVLLDLNLPDSDGLDTLSRVRVEAPNVPVVVLTAFDDEALAAQALQKGAQDYLVKGYVQVYRDLLGRALRYAVERKHGQEELDQARAQTDRLLGAITSILIGVDVRGMITHWNTIAELTFGIPESAALSNPIEQAGIPWDAETVLRSIAQCRVTDAAVRLDDVQFKRPDGREGLLGLTVIPLKGDSSQGPGVLIFGADVTERKQAEAERLRLQDQLAQAQRLETIGRFAGGIAHDFQNFLQVILGFAWLIRARHREDRELISDLQEIVHASESASKMVRQMLTFSRQQPLQPVIFDLGQAVQNMARLLQQLVGEQVCVVLEMQPGPLLVRLDPTGFEQVLMNLAANARDAMPTGGTLTVRAEPVSLSEDVRRRRPWAKVGEYVRLSVKDTGVGMEPAVAAHIFEPFFTTKRLGKGTGLGLAVVHGLVEQHGGLVDLETASGQGSTFHLYLPQQAHGTGPSAKVDRPSGTERLLLVEGEERQRAFAEEVLRESGYHVTVATDMAHAERQLGAPSPDAVLLDVTLSDVGPAGLVQRLRTARADVKILLVSPYASVDLRALERSLPGLQVLLKPYAPAQLLDSVRQLLDAPAAALEPAAKRRMLVVDDDASIRALCERLLGELCDVEVAASGEAALSRLDAGRYDLLLTDILMPGMDGIELIRRAEQRQPELKILVMTGSMAGAVEQRFMASGRHHEVLRKPFQATTLQDVVRRYLT